ncbi:MAG: hypothetical protein KF802_00120 [Bdellovibrionaceae bacterium]|nr:hypothetical protein [Pseudobdellovibrionaceae bacterium]MBX3034775.1 hypothetical protein [Pseudobdellovibrionaceae bacterium]
MMKMILASLWLGLAVSAHEGHDAPGAITAPKGGIVRSLEEVHLELLAEGKTLRLYAYSTDLKPADVTKYPVSATVTLPKKKAVALPLVAKGDHWEAQFDAKGAHRYKLEIRIQQGGHDDKVSYNVEPK